VNEYYEYFGPDYKLDVRPNNMENLNTHDYLDKVRSQVFEHLKSIPHAPSVQGHVEPRLAHDEALEDDADEDDDPTAQDERSSKKQRERDRRVQRSGELSDSEDEGEGGRRDRTNHSDKGRPPSIMEPLLRREGTQQSSLPELGDMPPATGAVNGNGAATEAGQAGASEDVDMADS
jgi:histone deacetylase 1/2